MRLIATSRAALLRWLQLVDEGEPFRMLFPVGWALGLVGVLLWPAWVWNLRESYPGIAHARIMMQGHLSAFVFGFLCTSLPRLIDAPRFRLSHIALLTLGLVCVSGLHMVGAHPSGDFAYLLVFSALLLFLAGRWRQRGDVPPPSFVLVALGLLSGYCGTALLVFSQFAPGALPGITLPLAHLLTTQAFVVLPVMGVGAFLLPRFFGKDSRQNFPGSKSPPPGWSRPAAFALACGILVLLSFLAQANGDARFAFLLRGAVLVTYLLVEVPAFQPARALGNLATAIRTALIALPLGYLIMAILPLQQLGLLHVVFITGFSLLTFGVASRVLLGHSGQGHRFNRQSWTIRILISGFIIAMITRVSADWMPDVRFSHYAYAALIWAAAASFWAVRFLPAAATPDPDEAESGNNRIQPISS